MTTRNRLGNWKAWAVAAARPSRNSTQTDTARKASTTGIATNGVNSTANGVVSRRVTAGSVTTLRMRSASSGFARRSSGSLPSASRRRRGGGSVASTRWSTSSGRTSRPDVSLTTAATSATVRRPSIAATVWWSSGVSVTTWPSPRRASAGGCRYPDPGTSPSSSTPSARSSTSPSVPAGAPAPAGTTIGRVRGSLIRAGSLLDGGLLVGRRVRVGVDVLRDDRVLLRDGGGHRVDRPDVGRRRGVDRGRHVRVRRDRAVDRRGKVQVAVEVDVDVEQVAVERSAGAGRSCRSGGRRRIRGSRLGDSVRGARGLVDAADLWRVRDRLAGDLLVDQGALVRQRLGGRAVGQDVRADGGLDGRRDVGVGRHGQIDGRRRVEGDVQIGVEVEQRDDFLVGQRGGALRGELLGRERLPVVLAHGSSSGWGAGGFPAVRQDK